MPIPKIRNIRYTDPLINGIPIVTDGSKFQIIERYDPKYGRIYGVTVHFGNNKKNIKHRWVNGTTHCSSRCITFEEYIMHNGDHICEGALFIDKSEYTRKKDYCPDYDLTLNNNKMKCIIETATYDPKYDGYRSVSLDVWYKTAKEYYNGIKFARYINKNSDSSAQNKKIVWES